MKAVIILVTLLLAFASAVTAHAQSLEAMDAVVAKAKNLKEFLARKDLIDEYYKAATAYYGEDKFQRVSYDKILEQMGTLAKKVSGFADRMWEKNDLGTPFAIATAAKSYGRNFDPANWRRFREEWTALLKKKKADTYRRQVPNYVNELKKRIAEFETQLAAEKLPRKPREKRSREFYEQLKAEPEFEQVAAWIVAESLNRDKLEDLEFEASADQLLAEIEKLRQNPKTLFEERGITDELPGVLLSQVQKQIPTVQELLAREDIFPKIMITTRNGSKELGSTGFLTYDFVPIPRRIHGVFEGIPLGECVGGGCGHIKNLTPERWAVIALKGSQRYHVEKNGNYLGFVGLTPIEAPAQGKERPKIYGSVDLGSPALSQSIAVRIPGTNRIETVSLFDAWVLQELAAKPKEWAGLVIGDGHDINNAGVLSTARKSVTYAMGEKLGESKTFRHIDPMAKSIIKRSPAITYSYGGRMIFDAFSNGTRKLTALSSIDPTRLNDPNWVSEMLKTATDEDLVKLIEQIPSKMMNDPGFRSLLIDTSLEREANFDIARKAIGNLVGTRQDKEDAKLLERLIHLALSDQASASQASRILFLWTDRDNYLRRELLSSHEAQAAITRYLAGDRFSGRAQDVLEKIFGNEYFPDWHLTDNAITALKSESPEIRLRGLKYLAKASSETKHNLFETGTVSKDILVGFVLDPEMGSKAIGDVGKLLSDTHRGLTKTNIQNLVTWLETQGPSEIEPNVRQLLNLYPEPTFADSIVVPLLGSNRDEVVLAALQSISYTSNRLPKTIFDEIARLSLSPSKSVSTSANTFLATRILEASVNQAEFMMFIENYSKLSETMQIAIRARIEQHGYLNGWSTFTLKSAFDRAPNNETKARLLELIPPKYFSDRTETFLGRPDNIEGIEDAAARTLQRIERYWRCRKVTIAMIGTAAAGTVVGTAGYFIYKDHKRDKQEQKQRESEEQDRARQRQQEQDEYIRQRRLHDQQRFGNGGLK